MKLETPQCTVSLPLLSTSRPDKETAAPSSQQSLPNGAKTAGHNKQEISDLHPTTTKEAIQEDGATPGYKKGKHNKYRVIYTVVLYASFLAFALCRNMYGPTLVELQIITGTNIDQISTVFTWLGAGGIAGSLTYGFLYDRFATAPLLVTTLVLLCVVTCLIPIFHWIVTMMILCAIQAFLFNGISIGCNVTILQLWGKRSTSLLLGMHVLYTIGGFIVPLLSEPFMVSRNGCPPLIHTNTSSLSTTPCVTGTSANAGNLSSDANTTSEGTADLPCAAVNYDNVTSLDRHLSHQHHCGSQIQYVYLIIGLYAGIAAILNALTHWKSPVKLEVMKSEKKREVTRKSGQLVTSLAYVLFIMFNFCFGGQEMTFSGLLFTYSTEHVGMSTMEGSLLVSALFACYGVGRLGGVVIAKCVTPRALLLVDLACGSTVALFLAYFTVQSPLALWMCTVVSALALSTVFCSALIWARDFVSVGGNFTSVYVIAYTTGMMTWPPLTGFLVRERGPKWFPYINLLLTISCCLFYGALIALKFACKARMQPPVVSSRTMPPSAHLQVNRKLLFTSFHGSLPQLQGDFKML